MNIKENGSHRKHIWLRLLIPLFVAGILVWTFIGITRTSAQAQIHFTDCASNSDNNATIGIPSTAPKIHTSGYFTPEVGDEFAIFRPVGGSCTTHEPSFCAGVAVWNGGTIALAVWGDNSQTPAIDGMLVGEEMCWRVWDTSADLVYTATVEYNPDPAYNSTGLYAFNGIYLLDTLNPTSVTVKSISAVVQEQTPLMILMGALAILLIGGMLLRVRRAQGRQP